jgi:hypothetical protein
MSSLAAASPKLFIANRSPSSSFFANSGIVSHTLPFGELLPH